MTTSYLLRTTPQGELKAIAALQRTGLEAFVPTEYRALRVSRHTKKKRIVAYPLTPRYVVAQIDDPHAAIHAVDEITAVVESAGQSRLTERDISALRRMDGSTAATVVHKSLAVGQAVIVRSGPFRDHASTLAAVTGDRGTIHLDLLGKRTPVDILLDWLDPG